MRIGMALLAFSLSCSSFENGDAAADGADGGAASAKLDCSAHVHDLCDDMNDGVLAKSPPWDKAPARREQFTYVSDAVSPPRALRIENVAGPPSEGGPHLQATLARPMSGLTCDVDLRLDAIGASDTSATLLTAVLKAAAGSTYTFMLLRVANGVYVTANREGGVEPPLPLPPDVLPMGSWRHVHVEITPGNDQPLLISIEGDKPRTVGGGTSFAEAASATVSLGFSVLTPGWTVLVDNFVCDHR